MVDNSRDSQTLSDEEWERLVRNLICTIAQHVTRNRGNLTKVAQATNLSKASIVNMRKTGKASVVSFIRVTAYFAGFKDYEINELLANPGTILRNLEPASEIDALFDSVRKEYSDNELAAWLKLLLAKRLVESELGITLKATFKKNLSKKNLK